MSLNGNPRSIWRQAIGIQAIVACAALFALLAIRNVPPDFPQTPSLHHSSISAVSSHDQRPHFDSNGSQWSAPVSRFLQLPPTSDPAHLTPTRRLLSALQTKGFHYNRPPPVS